MVTYYPDLGEFITSCEDVYKQAPQKGGVTVTWQIIPKGDFCTCYPKDIVFFILVSILKGTIFFLYSFPIEFLTEWHLLFSEKGMG